MRLATIVGTLLAFVLAVPAARAQVPPLDRPDGKGDQLIFYYDAREGFTTFLNVATFGGTVNVRLAFYGPTFNTPFLQSVTIQDNGLQVVDVGALRGAGLPAQQGIAFASVVNGTGQSIVSGALEGNFTVANLVTGSAWGAPAPARSARNANGSLASPAAVIDSSTVILQPIQPANYSLASYYNPASLAPATSRGNQLIFVSFEDTPGDVYSATVAGTPWNVTAARSNGAEVADLDLTVNGVTETDLVTLIGDDANGAPGRISFSTPGLPPRITRLIFFAEALGTFGTGYLLPSVQF